MDKNRVVVTGVGMITPLGLGVEESWNNLIAGRSGIRRITQFDSSKFSTQIAGEVGGFNPEDYIELKEIKKMDRFIHLAIAAAKKAIDDSGLKITNNNAERVGVIVGSGIGGLGTIEHYHSVIPEVIQLEMR
jgi:3-oxoacyl-[acyl-carrier-protein] synthase II